MLAFVVLLSASPTTGARPASWPMQTMTPDSLLLASCCVVAF
jgi:hypothetical protein